MENESLKVITGEDMSLESLKVGLPSDFRSLARSRGLLRALSIKKEGLLYRVWLWSLRECQIIKHLVLNYEKIPKKSGSRLVIYPFTRIRLLRNLLCRIDYSLQKRLIYQIVPKQNTSNNG